MRSRGFHDDGIASKWKGHDPLAVERSRRLRAHAPDFCETCARGEHQAEHTADMGCMGTVGRPPDDYPCRCPLRGRILMRLRVVKRAVLRSVAVTKR